MLADDWKDLLRVMAAVFGIAAALLVPIIGGSILLDRATCLNTWGESGQAVRWGVTSGCRLEIEPGVWRPAPTRIEVTP